MKQYEAVILFDPNLSDDAISEQVKKCETIISSHSGTVEKQEIWGKRELAYRIQKRSYAIYAYLIFSADGNVVADLRRQLRINDLVIRSLVVKKDKYSPESTTKSYLMEGGSVEPEPASDIPEEIALQ